MLKFSNIFFIKHHFFISVQNFELFIISILLVLVMMLKHDLLVHSILTLVVTAIVLGESNFFLLFSFPSLLERQLNLRNIFSKFNYQEVNLLFWIFSLFFCNFCFLTLHDESSWFLTSLFSLSWQKIKSFTRPQNESLSFTSRVSASLYPKAWPWLEPLCA